MLQICYKKSFSVAAEFEKFLISQPCLAKWRQNNTPLSEAISWFSKTHFSLFMCDLTLSPLGFLVNF